MQLGAHVSAAGGSDQAPPRGHAIGADCIQIFTRNQRQWQAKPVTDDEAERFRSEREKAGLRTVMSHASYLLNFATPDPAKREKTLTAMGDEITRCHQLGVDYLNFHPGAHTGSGEATGIATIAECLNQLCNEHADKTDVLLVLENVAGQGSTLGRTFEELAAIIEKLEQPERFGICIDTAHAFAAGYALHTEEGWEAMWEAFERELGMERLVAFHANDSRAEFESRKDRHALLGRGHIGREAFRRLVTDPRTRDIPLFLETPAGEAGWAKEIAWLRAVAAGEDPELPDIEDAGITL
ncbi:MAG: deoxyribonuclease IV [Pseudomonadota bacterium]